MSKAFRIPTVDKDGFHYKLRRFDNLKYEYSKCNVGVYEVYEAFNLPIIKGNPFVKVNAN